VHRLLTPYWKTIALKLSARLPEKTCHVIAWMAGLLVRPIQIPNTARVVVAPVDKTAIKRLLRNENVHGAVTGRICARAKLEPSLVAASDNSTSDSTTQYQLVTNRQPRTTRQLRVGVKRRQRSGKDQTSENHSTQGTASEAGHDAGGSRAPPPAPRPPPAPPPPPPARLNPLKRAPRGPRARPRSRPSRYDAAGPLSGPGAVGTRGRMGSAAAAGSNLWKLAAIPVCTRHLDM
jgi:hypothetical protein